jgi:protein-disulfide isomerase
MSKPKSNATKQSNAQRAAERAATLRAEQERTDRRKRTLWITGAVVAVLALIVVVFVVVQAGRDTTGKAATPPAGAVDTYSVPMGAVDAPVTVTVYEDFMCPYCGDFEQVSSERLKKYAESGDVQVRYHVVSFLDDTSSTDYSTRAANALAVVLDTAGPEAAVKFHDELYANQPEEGSAGIPDQQLIDMAVEAGADAQAITGPIEDLKFEQWVVNSTDEWSSRGFNSTPTVTVNGEKVEFTNAQDLLTNTESAIEAALSE